MSSLGGFARHAWSVVCWIGLSGLVAAALAALYYYTRVDDELHRFVERKLSEAYPELGVSVGSVHLVPGEGVQIDQLSLRRPQTPVDKTHREIGYAESITVHCNASLPSLLKGRLAVRRVSFRGLNVTVPAVAGKLDFSELAPSKLPLPNAGPLPQLRFDKTSVRIVDAQHRSDRPLELDDIEVRLRLKRLEPSTRSVSRIQLAFEGECRTQFSHRVEFGGGTRLADGAWTLQARFRDVDISSQSIDQLPPFAARWLPTEATFHARGSIKLQAQRSGHHAPLQFKLQSSVSDASWQDPQWPQPISDLQCQVTATEKGLRVTKLSGRYGEAQLQGTLMTGGYQLATCPYALDLQFEHLPVSRRLIKSFPPVVQTEWEKLQATGLLSGTFSCRFDGDQLYFDSTLECKETSIVHYKFPYRVTDCHGTVRLNSDRCDFDVQGLAGEAPVTMTGQLNDPGPGFTGWWEVQLEDWKSIDKPLIAALSEEARRMVQQLQLRGRIGCYVRGERHEPFRRKRPKIVVAVDDGWIQYEKFPYPISRVRGRIESTPAGWRFENLEGWNDDCRIACSGHWYKQTPSKELELKFDLHNIRLDEELRQALPTPAQVSWSQLRPRGLLDQADVRLFKTRQMDKLDIDVHIVHHPEKQAADVTNTVHIHPLWFPLPLTDVRGEAYLRNNSITLQSISAQHGPTRFRTNGKGKMMSDGRWRMNLTECSVDRITLRDPILNALPESLSQALRQIKLGGMFSIAGAMHFLREQPAAPVTSSWDLTLNIQRGQLVTAIPIRAIFGEIRFSGASHGKQARTRGEMQIDSLMANETHVTDVKGPIWIDNSRLVLGHRVPRLASNQTSSPIEAEVYDGHLTANYEVAFRPDWPFLVEVDVNHLDVSRLARDWRIGQGNLAGRGQIELTLQGNSAGRHTFKGGGRARLREATMYELPLILAVLNRISSGRSDNAAFTSSDVTFRVDAGYIYFDQFDLEGDALTLKGLGDMSFDRELRLDFYTIMGRERRWSPLVRPFLGQASRQFLQIHVNGPLNNPRATQEVLPGINDTLRQLFPEQTAPIQPAQRSRPTTPTSR